MIGSSRLCVCMAVSLVRLGALEDGNSRTDADNSGDSDLAL